MKRFLFLILMIILFNSCLEEITLKDQKFETDAVIVQGKLIKGSPSIAEVKLERVGDFNGFQTATYLSGASVKLIDEKGGAIELPEKFSQKIYAATIPQNHPNFRVETGKSYRLEFTLANGQRYESTLEPLQPVPVIDAVDFKKIERTRLNEDGVVVTDNYLQFLVSTQLKPADAQEKARLRWELFSAFRVTDDSGKLCYYYEPLVPSDVFIYNGDEFNVDKVDMLPQAEVLLNFRFAEGFYLTMVQESLSKEAFVYWDQIRKLIERSGNMFDPPPGKITSNLKNITNPEEEVYGYFYATEQDTFRMLIRPNEVGNPQTYCPLPPPKEPPPSPTWCDDCLLRQGSTLWKPGYWIE